MVQRLAAVDAELAGHLLGRRLESGIHALPIINGTTLWGGLLGSPASYGCVVLETADAATLYNWADIGTPVEIHD
ncbi:MAG: L,D-transpeptidase [Anaerolineae bacterium]